MRERSFILASAHQILGETEQAIPAYKALLHLYPDHYEGNWYLSLVYDSTSRYLESAPYRARMAELRPNSMWAHWNTATALGKYLGKPEEARPYIERGLELINDDSDPYIANWFRFRAAPRCVGPR